jgi:GntR family transcriptional repressor for pyruvate dehydrogenase complex
MKADRVVLDGVDPIRPAYAQVASQLRSLIIQGDLRSGQRLPNESMLAQRFGVSRTTTREALRVLSSQGLVTTERGVTGGTFISSGNPDAIVDLLEMGLNVLASNDGLTVFELIECREMLEVPGAGFAAKRRTDADLRRLEQLLEPEHEASEAFEETFANHREFHLRVLEAAQNRALAVILEPLFGVLEGFAQRLLADVPLRELVECDHSDLYEAIRSQDAEAASSVMQAHLDRLRALYADASA